MQNQRRKPMHNGGGRHSGQNNRPRHNNGGGNYNNNRPRKNYPQLREKYMNQARDALSAGDRVMAEYYFQHADHCYRMMMEEGSHRQPQQHNNQQANAQEGDNQPQQASDDNTGGTDDIPQPTTALPAFLTMGGAQPAANPVPVQDWEERDSQ